MLALVEECEVCDDTEGDLESYHGHRMHESCAPGHWVKDRKALEEFMAAIERKRKR